MLCPRGPVNKSDTCRPTPNVATELGNGLAQLLLLEAGFLVVDIELNRVQVCGLVTSSLPSTG
jgi:hypothetical protein